MKSLNEAFEQIADRVQEECNKMRICGVLVAAHLDQRQVHYRCICVSEGPVPKLEQADHGRDVNLLGIAFEKFTTLYTYRTNTGEERRPKVMGEIHRKGGILGQTGEFGYCFAGADDQVDVYMANLAETTHQAL